MTTSEDSKAAVMRLYQAYASRDPGQITACLTEDVRWYAPPGNATAVALGLGRAEDAGGPPDGNILDRDAIVHFMTEDFGRLFVAEVRNDFRLMLAEGAHVVTEARLSARLANGRTYANDYCFLYRVEDGRVAEIREYMDTRGGWAQVFGDGPAEQLV